LSFFGIDKQKFKDLLKGKREPKQKVRGRADELLLVEDKSGPSYYYEDIIKQIGEELALPAIMNAEEITDELVFDACLSERSFHEEYVKRIYPDKKIYLSMNELEEDDFDIRYFITLQDEQIVEELNEIGGICVKRNSDDKIFVGFVTPSLNIHIDFEDYFFIDASIYSYFHGVKTITIGDQKETDFVDILKYMETNEVSDLHFQLADEFSYYFTARFGQEVVKITDHPVLKSYIEKIYNQALLQIGKDNLSDPPEVSGLIKEKLIHNKGHIVDRTFRFHSMYDNKAGFQGRAVSIRRLMNYKEIDSLGLEGLNYSQKAIELIMRASNSSHGVIFITGKTNSGKSTLLYAILNQLYKDSRRIKSIESPIEIVSPWSQVDLTATEDAEEKYRMTRKIAVAALLRQDPDVVLISEVRTKDEVDEYVELGLKGHLAYTTMHTGSVQETVSRALRSVETPDDLQQTMSLIVSQELVRKKCTQCDGKKVSSGGGVCDMCKGLGIKGVLPIYEIAYFHHLDGAVDDIRNLRTLIKKGKVDYISKKDIIKDYYNRNLILKEDFLRVMDHEIDLAEPSE
jgi:Tfp pilus assembly pilus retraction ATPase PilT